MRFIFTSQGNSGSASLARSLNLVENIFAVHGHFPIDKNSNINYQNNDLSHLLGHSMKGIYNQDLNTIFEFLEDCFPEKDFHGLVHTFTLNSIENKLKEYNSSKQLENIFIANILRDPEKVYLSSRALIKKSLKYSRYGKKEYLDNYQNLLSLNPLLFSIINKIEVLEFKNPLAAVEIIVSANALASMFNEAGNMKNSIKSFKIEDILNSEENFFNFLSKTINFTGSINNIPEEITRKVNSHRNQKSDYTITSIEKVLIDYFLNNNGRDLMNHFYPNNFLNKNNFGDQQIFLKENLNKENILSGEILRNMRENLVLNSLYDNQERKFDFIQEKLNSTIATIDNFLINFEDSNVVINNNWCEKIEFIGENKIIKANIIDINNESYIIPQNLGEINPNKFASEQIFLERYPSIKKVNRSKFKFIIKVLNKIKLLKKNQ